MQYQSIPKRKIASTRGFRLKLGATVGPNNGENSPKAKVLVPYLLNRRGSENGVRIRVTKCKKSDIGNKTLVHCTSTI